jgi:hypothetical protein
MKRALLSFLILSATGVPFANSSQQAMPALKPGLWEWHYRSSASGDKSAVPQTMCIGSMPDQQRQLENANIKKRCSKWESRQLNGNWVVDAVCSTPRGIKITKHVVTSLAGDSVHEENTAPQGSSSSDGKWLGPCKPGQKPDTLK